MSGLLVGAAAAEQRAELDNVLACYPHGFEQYLATNGVSVRFLASNERYADASPALTRLGIAVDGWPAPPSGLFVVEERTALLRGVSPMTIAHELAHAF